MSTHWHFITVSYLIFFVLLFADWMSGHVSKRRLERDLRARLRREQASQKTQTD